MDKNTYEEFIKDFEKFIDAMNNEEFEQFCNEVGAVDIKESTDPNNKSK